MSGVEIISLVASIIDIIEFCRSASSAIKDGKRLPKAFRHIDSRLPLIESVLKKAKQHVETTATDTESTAAAKDVLEACKEKAEELKDILQSVESSSEKSRLRRYVDIVKSLGNGKTIESLMSGILEDLQLLHENQTMGPAIESCREDIAQALKEMSEIEPSYVEESTSRYQNVISGMATQNVHQGQGDQNLNLGDGQQYVGNTMNFGVKSHGVNRRH